MSLNNKVVWSEGLFLRPQHFQQQDRYLERFVEGRTGALRSHCWGFTELEVERDLLAIGKLALKRARGVFPDGTPFAMPDDDSLPPPLELSAQIRDQRVYLAIPLRKAGARECDRNESTNAVVRYRAHDVDAIDVTTEATEAQSLEVARLRSRLLLSDEPRDAFACIPVAHILECRADRSILLDDRFMPTVLDARQASALVTFVTELRGLLHQRGEALAARAVATGRGGAAEIGDFLMLQTINRYEPVVGHLAQSGPIHPEELYRLWLAIMGDLATLTMQARRPPQLSHYQHENLRASFEPLMNALRACFNVVLQQNAVPIPIQKKRFNISVATVADKALFDEAALVLAVRADVPADQLRRDFAAQVTVASMEKIARLVNEHLSGVPLHALAVAPRQIPFHAGFAYFELDRASPLYAELKTGGGIALHIPDSFPGLVIEMWGIRG